MSLQAIPPLDLSFLWLEITAKCNLECGHCYADSGPRQQLFGEMSTEEWLQVLAEGSSQGCRQVQFIGGEPTLHPDLPQMIAYAGWHGYSFIEIFTNATHVDDNLVRALIEHRANVATSFYSKDPVIHDAITRRQGSFVRTVKNIRRLISDGIPVRAGIIETPSNVGHAAAARGFLESLGVKDIKVDTQRGVGRGAMNRAPLDPMAELCGECWKGKLCVTSSGKAYPCVFSRFVDLGSAKRGIKPLLASDPLRQFRAALRAAEYAQTCNPTCSPCTPESFRECSPDLRCSPGGSADCVPRSSCSPNCSPSSGCGPSGS